MEGAPWETPAGLLPPGVHCSSPSPPVWLPLGRVSGAAPISTHTSGDSLYRSVVGSFPSVETPRTISSMATFYKVL